MSGLADIAIRIEDLVTVGNVRAIGHEIASLLERLATHGECGAVDLKSLPVGSSDRALLAELLGVGEVQAEIAAFGVSRVRETAYPGVWWVTHENSAGQMIAEFIEVTPVPEILCAPADELAGSCARLRARLGQFVAGPEDTRSAGRHGQS
jgi:hydrogenase-1 operon protein HyaF